MNKLILFFGLMISILALPVYAEIPETAVRVNGYLLDWCSHHGCGEATANMHCARIGEGVKAANFEKGTGASLVGGTWRYSMTGGYHRSNGDEYFALIECGFTGQYGSILYAHGYPLDYCSYAGCGQETADIYCQREENTDNTIDFMKGTSIIMGGGGTYVYTQTGGYNNPNGKDYFKTIICDESQYPPDFNATCINNSDCGEDGWLTEYGVYLGPRCVNGIIYQPHKSYTCENPGTLRASCTSSVNAWKIKEECEYGCVYNQPNCNPPPEICDGIDNDFDGEIDENNPCDDGLYCNGLETCQNGVCMNGTEPDCSDGISCTADVCYEWDDSCIHVAMDHWCDDGLWCNGKEICNKQLDCQAGTPPCDDTVKCTDNICNEATDKCSYATNNANCDDGLFCNGQETCHQFLDCLPGTPKDRTEGCITYICNEQYDIVFRDLNDAYCNDGLWCNGFEWCSIYGCQSGTPRNCNDGKSCTTDSCNEASDKCDNIPIDGDSDGHDLCTGDCNDDNSILWQLLPGYVDNDLDTYGVNPLLQVCSGVSLPIGYVTNSLDCDDSDVNSYPGAEEVLDRKDNDCDSLIDEYLCGNGILDLVGEQCDDGNLVNGDGCTDTCASESLAGDFDEVNVENNGDGTYDYTFISDGVPMIFIPGNEGFIDLINTTFDYDDQGNVVYISIGNLTLVGTTKTVTIEYKKDLCILDKPSVVIGGNPSGIPDCFSDPARIVWRKSLDNECNQATPVLGKDQNGIDVLQYSCTQINYGGNYAEISGLNHTVIIGIDDADNDGFSSAEDCDDSNPLINPDAIEIPGNDIDENCDESILCNPDAEWKNHGKFVSCVAKEAEKLLEEGLITQEEKDALVSEAAKSKNK